jgi:hypothetical protein
MQSPALEIKAPASRRIALPATYLSLAQYVSQTYFTLVPLGHTPEDLLQPEYWMHAARKLRPNYFIRVRAEDGSFDGELLVIQASDTWAKCVWFILNRRDGSERADADYSPKRDNFKIEPNAKGWRVIEKASAKIIAKDLPQKVDAEKALDLYLEDMKH